MSTIEIARETFERIKAAHPHLEMEIETSPQYVELAMNIKKQKGLDFDVYLNLQNDDELHLQFESFWGEWFPCTESARTFEYEAAVNGVLSGTYRTMVISRRGSPVKALLQAPSTNQWSTVFTWGKLHLPLGSKAISYVQNQKHT